MKLIPRSIIALVFLLGLATPLLAQSPNVAVRISKPSHSCFPVTLDNLQTMSITCKAAYVTIFDQKECKKVCEFKMPFEKKLSPCKPLSFRICCEKPLPSSFICYVRVNHSLGNNEGWFFNP